MGCIKLSYYQSHRLNESDLNHKTDLEINPVFFQPAKAKSDNIVENRGDYYPFGMEMPGRVFNLSTVQGNNIYLPGNRNYPFSFNGKLKENELYGEGNGYDFGARMYDPRLGRWFSVDPQQTKYPSFAPYCFAGNTPIIAKDYNGKWIAIYDDESDLITKTLNEYFNNNIVFSLDENSHLVLNVINISQLNSEQKEVYSYLQTLSLSTENNIGIYIVPEDPIIIFDSWEQHKIDKSDIEQLPTTRLKMISIIHCFAEQENAQNEPDEKRQGFDPDELYDRDHTCGLAKTLELFDKAYFTKVFGITTNNAGENWNEMERIGINKEGCYVDNYLFDAQEGGNGIKVYTVEFDCYPDNDIIQTGLSQKEVKYFDNAKQKFADTKK